MLTGRIALNALLASENIEIDAGRDGPAPPRLHRLMRAEVVALAPAAALAGAGVEAGAIDTIVTISSTGVATPTIEARVLHDMGFRDDVKRVPVFGLGCAGGVSGLSLAARLAAAADRLLEAGADRVIDTVADLIPALEAEAARRA